MQNILISGLCLQGNKGGPALALSMMNALKAVNPDLTFTMLISPGPDFVLEMQWAKKYGINIVEDISVKETAGLMKGLNFQRVLKKWNSLFRTIRMSGGHINMTGVAYVGPPIGTQRFASGWSRLRLMILSGLVRTPFIGWTQSYGPFGTGLVQKMARMDLRRQKRIYCRGANSAEVVAAILPDAKTIIYPDIAFSLDYDKDQGHSYLSTIVDGDLDNIVTVSPSSVNYAKAVKSGSVDDVIAFYRHLCTELIDRGFTPVVVPHTVRPLQPDPNVCDLEFSRIICKDLSGVVLVESDLSVNDLKAIFSLANIHVGARYHSLVGALGSGTPAISLSWHPKYRDLMDVFGLGLHVYDLEDLSKNTLVNILDAISALSLERDKISKTLTDSISDIRKQNHYNARDVLEDLNMVE